MNAADSFPELAKLGRRDVGMLGREADAALRRIDNLTRKSIDRDNLERANESLRHDLLHVRGTNADLVSAVTDLERKVQILEGDSTPSLDKLGWSSADLEAEVADLTREVERFKGHSVIANSATWKLAGMLGVRPEGDPGPVECPGLLELVDLMERQAVDAHAAIGRAMGHLRHAVLALPTVETDPKAERVSDGPFTIREGA